jgi:hypothetical protein
MIGQLFVLGFLQNTNIHITSSTSSDINQMLTALETAATSEVQSAANLFNPLSYRAVFEQYLLNR